MTKKLWLRGCLFDHGSTSLPISASASTSTSTSTSASTSASSDALTSKDSKTNKNSEEEEEEEEEELRADERDKVKDKHEDKERGKGKGLEHEQGQGQDGGLGLQNEVKDAKEMDAVDLGIFEGVGKALEMVVSVLASTARASCSEDWGPLLQEVWPTAAKQCFGWDAVESDVALKLFNMLDHADTLAMVLHNCKMRRVASEESTPQESTPEESAPHSSEGGSQTMKKGLKEQEKRYRRHLDEMEHEAMYASLRDSFNRFIMRFAIFLAMQHYSPPKVRSSTLEHANAIWPSQHQHQHQEQHQHQHQHQHQYRPRKSAEFMGHDSQTRSIESYVESAEQPAGTGTKDALEFGSLSGTVFETGKSRDRTKPTSKPSTPFTTGRPVTEERPAPGSLSGLSTSSFDQLNVSSTASALSSTDHVHPHSHHPHQQQHQQQQHHHHRRHRQQQHHRSQHHQHGHDDEEIDPKHRALQLRVSEWASRLAFVRDNLDSLIALFYFLSRILHLNPGPNEAPASYSSTSTSVPASTLDDEGPTQECQEDFVDGCVFQAVDLLAVGQHGRWLSENIYNDSSNGNGTDTGMSFRTLRNFLFGSLTVDDEHNLVWVEEDTYLERGGGRRGSNLSNRSLGAPQQQNQPFARTVDKCLVLRPTSSSRSHPLLIRPPKFLMDAALDEVVVKMHSHSRLYLLRSFRHAHIVGCEDSTIYLGAVAGVLTIERCNRVKVVSHCGMLRVINCFDAEVYIHSVSQPLIIGDVRGLRLAPHNINYADLRDQVYLTSIKSGPLVAEDVVAKDSSTSESWCEPLKLDAHSGLRPARKDDAMDHLLLDPAKFSVDNVPRSLGLRPQYDPDPGTESAEDGSLPACAFRLPVEYAKVVADSKEKFARQLTLLQKLSQEQKQAQFPDEQAATTAYTTSANTTAATTTNTATNTTSANTSAQDGSSRNVATPSSSSPPPSLGSGLEKLFTEWMAKTGKIVDVVELMRLQEMDV